MASKPRRCLCCGKPLKDKEVLRRGLRPACYNAALREIEAGGTTWVELEKNGLVTGKQLGKPRSAIRKKIAELSSASRGG